MTAHPLAPAADPAADRTAGTAAAPAAPPRLPAARLDLLDDVAANLAARAADHDRDASFPADGIAQVHAAGLLTATVGTRYGGPGHGLADGVRILRALGSGDPSVALVTAMTLFTHAGQAHHPTWPAAWYARLLAESVDGPALVNALRVEPDLGTPARGGLPATTARADGDGWRLSGHKVFSTGAIGLRWMVVWARTDEDPVRVGGFLVRADSPGITIESTWDHLGLRASRSDDVRFTDVWVPGDATVGLAEPIGPDAGRPDPVQGAWNCLGLTALYLGVADAAFAWLTRFLHERVPSGLGAPLATLPRFAAEVGEIAASLTGSGEFVSALATRVDAGDTDAAAHAPAAKLLGTRAAIAAVERAVALVGNNGLTRHNPLQRHYRDVLCSRVHTPQDDTIVAALGRAVLDRAAPGTNPSVAT